MMARCYERPFATGPRLAFSLVEMLVAMTILAIICLLAVSLVDGSVRVWRDLESGEEGFREARPALNLFSRDLNNAIVGTTNTNFFHYESNRLAFVTFVPARFQRTGNDRSDLCLVGYSLEWGKVNPSDPNEKERYSLYRYLRFANSAFETQLLNGGSAADVFQNPDGSNTIRELLARNVLKFECDLYLTNAAGLPVDFAPSGTNVFPDIVNFSLTTLSERAVQRLEDQNAWTNTASPLIQQARETFSLRLPVRKPQAFPTTP